MYEHNLNKNYYSGSQHNRPPFFEMNNNYDNIQNMSGGQTFNEPFFEMNNNYDNIQNMYVVRHLMNIVLRETVIQKITELKIEDCLPTNKSRPTIC